jgi:glycosyltransferase involved in cell wall biosynthesis
MKKRITVLIISKQYPPDIGGGGTHAYYLAHTLATNNDIKVHVITSQFGNLPAEQRMKSNFTVFRIKFENSFALPYEPTIANCMELINKEKIKPDIIHAHHITGTYLGMHLSCSYQIPLISTIHKTPIIWDNTIIKRAPIYSHLKLLSNIECINIFIAGSEVFRNELIKLGVKREKIRFIYHGVPINTIQRLAFGKKKILSVINKLGLKREEYLLVCPTRIDRRKQLDVFVNAAGLLQDEIKNIRFRFVITGEPNNTKEDNYRQNLLEIANNYGIKDQLTFKTFDFQEIPALLGLAKACILPSSREGLGLVVLESLAIPTPVIVSQCVGVNEIIRENEKHGLIFLEGDVEDLARQLKLLVTNENLYKRIKFEGHKIVTDFFNAEKITEDYIRIYRELI